MAPTREQLLELRAQGYTREQISERFEVGMSTVRRWIKDMNIPRPAKQVRYKEAAPLKKVGALVLDPDDGMTLIEKAQKSLGDRLKEKRGVGYILDGRHVSTAAVVKAAGLKFKDE